MAEPDRPQSGATGPGTRTWLVVIEATAGVDQPPYSFDTVRRMVLRLADWRATGLYSSDRYAVQLDVEAAGCAAALRLAARAHDEAVHDLNIPPPRFLRAEILTPEVLKADWQDEMAPPRTVVAARLVPSRVYTATRAVLRATTTIEIRAVVNQFVADAGGTISTGARPTEPGLVITELGLDAREQIWAAADALSVGGLLIEVALPGLVVDARRAYQRLKRQPDPR